MPAIADKLKTLNSAACSAASGLRAPRALLPADALLSLGFQSINVCIEFVSIDAPNAALADLQRDEIAISHECVDLADSDIEVFSDFVRCEQPS